MQRTESGVDSDRLNGFNLCGGEPNGRNEAAQRQDFSTLCSKLPVSSHVDVVGVSNEVEFVENIFGRERFPFSIGQARHADDGGF